VISFNKATGNGWTEGFLFVVTARPALEVILSVDPFHDTDEISQLEIMIIVISFHFVIGRISERNFSASPSS
jgi:hypothetical protein